MSRTIKQGLFVMVMMTLILIFPLVMHAQPSDPGCDPLDPACPIDGGLSLLLAAGVGIGVKKAYAAQKKTQKS